MGKLLVLFLFSVCLISSNNPNQIRSVVGQAKPQQVRPISFSCAMLLKDASMHKTDDSLTVRGELFAAQESEFSSPVIVPLKNNLSEVIIKQFESSSWRRKHGVFLTKPVVKRNNLENYPIAELEAYFETNDVAYAFYDFQSLDPSWLSTLNENVPIFRIPTKAQGRLYIRRDKEGLDLLEWSGFEK